MFQIKRDVLNKIMNIINLLKKLHTKKMF